VSGEKDRSKRKGTKEDTLLGGVVRKGKGGGKDRAEKDYRPDVHTSTKD